LFERTGRGLDFDRVAFFSDAVFAISMTLLVVSINVPHVPPADVGKAIARLRPDIISFFISFIVIGYYWLAHHRFFSLLQSVDSVLASINLLYLAVIAFVPFPTDLVGDYSHVPLSVVLYAVTLAVASLLESILFAWAHGHDLMSVSIPPNLYRNLMAASLLPVAVFLLSIPLAFLFDSTLALLFWLIIFPGERLLERTRPSDAKELLSQ
jgi:TMEM175 potassium channel family protein